jgi:ferredoxin
MIDSAPLLKVAGEPKELHETRLGAALPVLDMHLYVEEFGRSVVPAYRRGIADLELPADAGLARSIIPPGTAATRDFSRLAPTIPEFLLEKCVGCMACVAACPDTAILARVIPEPDVPSRIEAFAATEDDPARATARASIVAHSASSSTPSTARGVRNASRSARLSAMTPW